MEWRTHNKAIAAGAAIGLAAVGAWGLHRARARRRAIKKGVFIEHALYDAPADALRELGITWVLVQTGIMKPDRDAWITRDRDALDRLVHRLNPPGSPYNIEIWGWGWPIPSRVGEFAEHTREILNSPLVTGYCLDIEAKSWSTRDLGEGPMDASARALIAEIRKGARKPLMLSSHGRADLTPLPWDALAQLDAGMPQCYDADGNKEPGFVQRCVDSYRKLGFSAVIPTLGASATGAEQMRRQVGELPPGLRAVSWWTWTQIGRSAPRAEVVSECCDIAGRKVAV